MCTKWFADGDVHKYFNPYDSPYEAFINFMNILSDFISRIDKKRREQGKDGTILFGHSEKLTLNHVVDLKDAHIKKVVRELNNYQTLSKALTNEPDEVKEKFYRNIASNAVEILKLNENNSVSAEEILKSKHELINIINQI